MIVIGVDPGDTTGLTAWDSMQPFMLQLSAQCKPDDMRGIIQPWLGRKTIIAYERFVIGMNTVKKKRTTATTDVIGMLRDMASTSGARRLTQSSADAKNFAPNARLKELKWYAPGMRHANDAARHMLLAIARSDPRMFDLLMKTL